MKRILHFLRKTNPDKSSILNGIQKNDLAQKNIWSWLTSRNFHLLIDIGANQGAFSKLFRSNFPEANIICFEPVADSCERLKIQFAGEPSVKVFRYALGNSSINIDLLCNDTTRTSSIRVPNDRHLNMFAEVNSLKESVEMRPLSFFKDHISLQNPVMIKIDAAGSEREIIEGGMEIITQCECVFLEVAFTELYKGQPLFHEMYELMHEIGFGLHGFYEQMHDPRNGAILQGDAIFWNRRFPSPFLSDTHTSRTSDI